VERTAEGVLEVVDSHMEHALRSVSVEEGADPREAVLVAFGGAGGLHAARLARRLGIAKVLIPPHSGVFSALGLLMAAPRADVARTVMRPEGDPHWPALLAEISEQATARFRAIFGSDPAIVEATSDLRYVGQSHELEVAADPSWESTRARFEEAHGKRNGFVRREEPIEAVNLRAIATGQAPLSWDRLPAMDPSTQPVSDGNVWYRETLPPDTVIEGPALVVETNSATLIQAGDRLQVLVDGTLEVTN
jgi:N-methylhydantoinase A